MIFILQMKAGKNAIYLELLLQELEIEVMGELEGHQLML